MLVSFGHISFLPRLYRCYYQIYQSICKHLWYSIHVCTSFYSVPWNFIGFSSPIRKFAGHPTIWIPIHKKQFYCLPKYHNSEKISTGQAKKGRNSRKKIFTVERRKAKRSSQKIWRKLEMNVAYWVPICLIFP